MSFKQGFPNFFDVPGQGRRHASCKTIEQPLSHQCLTTLYSLSALSALRIT